MGYKFARNGHYFMPTNYGMSRFGKPNQKSYHYTEVTSYAVMFLADKDDVAALLPEPMEPADPPVVGIMCAVNKGVEFLAGGNYNYVLVYLPTIFKGKKEIVEGNYAAAIWENDAICCILGREYLGVPKLYANIPDPQISGNNRAFHCSEYGHTLIEARIKNIKPADNATFDLVKQTMSRGNLLGWKYIPKPNGRGADLSNPVVVPTVNNIDQVWVGEGSHRFFRTAWENTPVSADIMKGLQKLRVKEYLPAMIIHGSQDLVGSEARNLR